MSQNVDLVYHFVVGLGNPGFDGTIHNIGSAFVDELMAIYGRSPLGVSLSFSSSLFCGGIPFQLIKPSIEMNSSGKLILKALKKRVGHNWKLTLPSLLIVAEDVDLDPGKARVRFGKSARGHNGVRSIVKELGSNLFSVLWIGVGRPSEEHCLSDYVLEPVPQEIKEKVQSGIRKGLLLFQKWLCSSKEA